MKNLVAAVIVVTVMVSVVEAQVRFDPSRIGQDGVGDQVFQNLSSQDLFLKLSEIGLVLKSDGLKISSENKEVFKLILTQRWGVDWADSSERYTLTLGQDEYHIGEASPAAPPPVSTPDLNASMLRRADTEVRIIASANDVKSRDLLRRVGITDLTPEEKARIEKSIPGFKVGNGQLPIAIADGKYAFASISYYSVPYGEYEKIKKALGQAIENIDRLVTLGVQLEQEWAEYQVRDVRDVLKRMPEEHPGRAEGEEWLRQAKDILREVKSRSAVVASRDLIQDQGNSGGNNAQALGGDATVNDYSVKIDNSVTQGNNSRLYQLGNLRPGLSHIQIRHTERSFRQISGATVVGYGSCD